MGGEKQAIRKTFRVSIPGNKGNKKAAITRGKTTLTASGALHETKDKRISGLSNRGRATTASSPLNFLALISFSEIPFSFDIVSRLASSHELDLNQYLRATFLLVDREWVCRPPHYSPPKINSISSEYILSFHLSSPMHSQYDSPNHGY